MSGSLHYFRIPNELWYDRLLRAKRAGLNCIETYIPWNFHELEEGKVIFDGDRDIAKFFDLCASLDLFVFVRPGPFICSEWDSGGYPAWLIGKVGGEFRTANELVERYIKSWFGQLIPRIAKYQVTRGGPVILVQCENEYLIRGLKGSVGYLSFLMETMREFGVEVPITDCNGFDLSMPGSLKTINGGDLSQLSAFKKQYPAFPAFLSELWTGPSITFWGHAVQVRPVEEVRQVVTDALAHGVMYNIYMFHGGTNFGFWGSNSVNSDHSWMTTRYDFSAPIMESGALSEKYFAVKYANLLGSNFQEFFCNSVSAPNPLQVKGPIEIKTRADDKGSFVFLAPLHPTRSEMIWRFDGQSPFFEEFVSESGQGVELETASIQLPTGEEVGLADDLCYPSMLPFKFILNGTTTVDFSNATMFGFLGSGDKTTLFFRGAPGRLGVVSINGDVERFVFPAEAPLQLTVGGISVVALPRCLADRTWFVDNRVVIGPAYVGKFVGSKHQCYLDGTESAVIALSSDAPPVRQHIRHTPRAASVITLRDWKGSTYSEALGSGLKWQDIDGPRSVEELGGYYGYTWYRASLTSDMPRTTSLFFTRAADRIHVFANGKRLGIWGRGPLAERGPLEIDVDRGVNQLTFLCDNMGRRSEGQAHERKGIWGQVFFDAKEQALHNIDWKPADVRPNPTSWQFQTYQFRQEASRCEFRSMRATVPLATGEGATLCLRWIPQFAWVYVNGQLVGEHAGNENLANGTGFSEFVLDPYIDGQSAVLELVFYGHRIVDISNRIHMICYPKSRTLTDWKFKILDHSGATAKHTKGYPTLWEADFEVQHPSKPLFLNTEGLGKGHVLINGNAVGRYWSIGPQFELYLPEPWLRKTNHLAILDEDGIQPDEICIVTDPNHLEQSIWI